jgi:hypothetical protein
MRGRLLITVLVLSLLAGFAGWWAIRDFRMAAACEQRSEAAWLRAEFGLDDAAIGRIAALQGEFEKECEVHCEAVRQAKLAMEAKPGPESKAGLEAALGRCERSRRAALLALSGCKPPHNGKTNHPLKLPQVEALSHEGAPGVDGHHKAR